MLRLGLICDYAEEGWNSMDLVGDMLIDQLGRAHSQTIQTDRLRPLLRRRATSVGALRSSHVAWNADRLWNRMVEYPLWLKGRTDEYDVFHLIDHSYAHLALTLPRGRTVITCHDLDTFRCLLGPARDPRPLWFRAMTRRILAGFRSAAHVVFVSEAVREEAERLGLLAKRTSSSVIHNGADFDAGAALLNSDTAAEREADELLGPVTAGPLLLSVGSTVERKRVDVLLRVFAGVAGQIPDVRLVRAGGRLTEAQAALAQQLGVAGSIVDLPSVSRAVLRAVYRRATLLLQPSDSEGFGLPVAEAMAQGCPVVVTDLPVLREVGGEAAIYCPAGDVVAWTASVTELLRRRRSAPRAWGVVRQRSRENAERFRWHDAATRMAGVYREVHARQVNGGAEARAFASASGAQTMRPAAQPQMDGSAVEGCRLLEERPLAVGHGR